MLITEINGGICEKYSAYLNGEMKSLNTGVLTFKNYGSIVPALVSHITFAHELGHSLGSPVKLFFNFCLKFEHFLK